MLASQEKLGLELASLIDDPQNASVRVIAAEAFAKLASGEAGPQAAAETMGSQWISPAPVTIKMRLFCLPYAGGVSENVYARCTRIYSRHGRTCETHLPDRLAAGTHAEPVPQY